MLQQFKGRTSHIWLGREIFNREKDRGVSIKKVSKITGD